MKAFLVANPKGGSGKSTLATNLAGYFASKRHEVMLGDIDRQQSSRIMSRGHPRAPAMSCSTRRPACTAKCSTGY